jgi:hypothetical protein
MARKTHGSLSRSGMRYRRENPSIPADNQDPVVRSVTIHTPTSLFRLLRGINKPRAQKYTHQSALNRRRVDDLRFTWIVTVMIATN